MSDGTEDLGQDEIEDLLRQASGDASGPAPNPPEEVSNERPTVEIGPPPPAHPASDAAYPPSDMDEDLQFLLNQAEEAIRSVDEPIENGVADLSPFELRQLGGAPASTERASLELLRDVELDLRIELGRTHMYLEEVLQLRKGSVVPLDKLAGDPVDVFVNGRLVARGEVLVLNDNFCVRIAELISGDELD